MEYWLGKVAHHSTTPILHYSNWIFHFFVIDRVSCSHLSSAFS